MPKAAGIVEILLQSLGSRLDMEADQDLLTINLAGVLTSVCGRRWVR